MLELSVQKRNILGKKSNSLRLKGLLPAVIYGQGVVSAPVQMKYGDFEKVYKVAGENTLVNINSKPVLIYNVTKDSRTGKFLHADFYQVKSDKKIKAKIPVVFIGESEAVNNLGGILVKNLYEVEVESLPKDLPKELTVDLSNLQALNDVVKAGDLALSKGVKIMGNLEEIIVSIVVAKAEEEVVESVVAEKEKIEAVKVVETKEKKKEKVEDV